MSYKNKQNSKNCNDSLSNNNNKEKKKIIMKLILNLLKEH